MASARSPKKTQVGTKITHSASKAFSLTCLILAYSRKTAGIKQVRSLLSMHYMLLGYNFKPRPTSRALDITGSGMTKRMPRLEKPV